MFQSLKSVCKEALDAVKAVGNRVIHKTKRYVAATLLTFGVTIGLV